jgi:pimeloyl-ACP methyl ester carboxylesterase
VLKLVLGCTFSCNKNGSGETEEYVKATGKDPRRIKLELASLANNRSFARLFVAIWMRLNSRSWEEGFESQGAAIRDHDTSERLHEIQSPTLVICGTKDRVIRPSSSDFLASKIPKARLVTIEGGSHSMSAENWKEFNAKVLAFLQ